MCGTSLVLVASVWGLGWVWWLMCRAREVLVASVCGGGTRLVSVASVWDQVDF